LCTFACGDPKSGAETSAGSAETTGTSDGSETTEADESTGTAGETGTDEGPKLDVGPEETDTGPGDICKPSDGMDAPGACEAQAPPASFEPAIQWIWEGEGTPLQSIATPLVANLTDDNGDEEIDLCDIPDVVIVASETYVGPAKMYLLDGETGSLHFEFAEAVASTVTPALGDFDGDDLPELVTRDPNGQMIAFEHDGTLIWKGEYAYTDPALGDMNNDGDPEIVVRNQIFDADGNLLATSDDWGAVNVVLADLDGDDDLEAILGRSAFHHDGTALYENPQLSHGFPHVADLDEDDDPEVLVTNPDGITMLEHDGTIKFQDVRPTGAAASGNNWVRPYAIHDFDGDELADLAGSADDDYAVYERDATLVWTAPVQDQTGVATGTAFDFLGDGIAEAMYADEHDLFIYDGGDGTVLLNAPRSSGTVNEYPVVADIDNDGSAEIVVVSNEGWFGNQTSPAVQVIRDAEDRWIQARRIWNQHSYHVTNVREDGKIPQFEAKHWTLLNTFRTQAQIEGGAVCDPEG
jgi:outer membrane protein assembly factor BamB